MTQNQKLGFIGMGTMGLPLAMHLTGDDLALTVWNRTRAKCAPIADRGAAVAGTPGEAAAGAAAVFAMVTDDEASEAVWLGADGALAAMAPGALVVEMSTISPGWSQRLAAHAAERGLRYLESPVAGGPEAAAEGSALLLVGGEAATLEQAQELLLRMGARIIHTGAAGTATTLKLARHLLLGVELAGLAELLTVATAAGIERDVVIRSVVEGPTASPVIKRVIGDMLDGGGGKTFNISHLREDLDYALAEGTRHGATLPVAAAARDLLIAAEQVGVGGEDISALARFVTGLRQQTGKQ